jgi:3-oxoacyl-[acyl-carrier protein] reductase
MVAQCMAGGASKHFQPKIVTISSVSAYAASVNSGDYCISKAGVSMLTALYAARLAEFGIGVYEVRPGVIASDMTALVKEKHDRLIAGGLTPIQRWGPPEDGSKASRWHSSRCVLGRASREALIKD